MSKFNIEKLEEEVLSAPGQWFAINCQTGHEEKVLADLQQKIISTNLQNEVYDVRISNYEGTTPTGKLKMKNKFPGYIFINMIMSERAWFIVRNTPGVTGFIGSSGRGAKPFPLTTDEVIRMLTPIEIEENISFEEQTPEVSGKIKGTAVPKKELKTADFAKGETVVIKSGIHEGQEGVVTDMDYSKGVATISLEIFGRYTPTEVSFDNAESIKEK